MLRCCALLAAGTSEALAPLTARRRIRATARHARRRRIQLSAAKGKTLHLAKKIGVAFCGRQASGGHNVVWGLHAFLKAVDKKWSFRQKRFQY